MSQPNNLTETVPEIELLRERAIRDHNITSIAVAPEHRYAASLLVGDERVAILDYADQQEIVDASHRLPVVKRLGCTASMLPATDEKELTAAGRHVFVHIDLEQLLAATPESDIPVDSELAPRYVLGIARPYGQMDGLL